MPAPMGHPNYATAPNLGGRPPRFSKEQIEQEADYFFEWLQDPKNIFFKHFASTRGYASQFLSEFAERNERFAEVFEYAKSIQESRVMTYGLFKKLDSGLVKFLMINRHGYNKDQIVTSEDNEMGSTLTDIDGNSKDIVNDPSKASN